MCTVYAAGLAPHSMAPQLRNVCLAMQGAGVSPKNAKVTAVSADPGGMTSPTAHAQSATGCVVSRLHAASRNTDSTATRAATTSRPRGVLLDCSVPAHASSRELQHGSLLCLLDGPLAQLPLHGGLGRLCQVLRPGGDARDPGAAVRAARCCVLLDPRSGVLQ